MIQQLIEETLQRDHDYSKYRVRSGKWNPSAFGFCYRRQYWQRKNEQQINQPDMNGLYLMAQGQATHRLIQGYLPPEIVEVEIETEDVIGYCDILTELSAIDIKGTEEWKYKRYKKIPTKIYVENNPQEFMQVGWYALEKKKPLCYIRANVFGSLQVFTMHEQRTADWKDRIEEELKILKNYWDTGVLPEPKPRVYGGNECNYCKFRDKCKELGI